MKINKAFEKKSLRIGPCQNGSLFSSTSFLFQYHDISFFHRLLPNNDLDILDYAVLFVPVYHHKLDVQKTNKTSIHPTLLE